MVLPRITTDKRAWEIGRSLDFALFMVLQMIFEIRVEDYGANGTQCIFIAGRGAENRPSVRISAGAHFYLDLTGTQRIEQLRRAINRR